jgi:DNA-binding MarR family transcriptional regulator
VNHSTTAANVLPGQHSVPADQQSAAEAATIIMRLFRALERLDTGLTPQQYRILRLAGAGGQRSARLAERLSVARPTLTATADGLVTAGYLQRQAEPGDRRVVRLCLTPAGRAALDAAEAVYAGWMSGLLADSGDPAVAMDSLLALESVLDERCRDKKLAAAAAPANGGTA